MNDISLSVIIVTWNGMRHLPRCLEALVPQLPPDAEVVQVDNGSTDGTVAWVRRTYPQIRLLALKQNTGFAGGVAAGLKVACGEYILLINDDAFVEPGFIAALLDIMRRNRVVGAASGVLMFEHRPELVASAGIRVRRDGLALDLWPGRPVASLPERAVEIMGPSGGAALYRRAALDDIGGFEPSFFAYLEDVDVALRLRLRGWSTMLVPQARARHVYSATSGQGSPFKQRLLARNRVRAIVRCLPSPLVLRLLPQILAYDFMASAYALLRRQGSTLVGRVEALSELPALLRQRRAIQSRRTTPIAEFARWLEPAPMPWETLREARRLEAILRERA